MVGSGGWSGRIRFAGDYNGHNYKYENLIIQSITLKKKGKK
jgi:hypothetical protein